MEKMENSDKLYKTHRALQKSLYELMTALDVISEISEEYNIALYKSISDKVKYADRIELSKTAEHLGRLKDNTLAAKLIVSSVYHEARDLAAEFNKQEKATRRLIKKQSNQ